MSAISGSLDTIPSTREFFRSVFSRWKEHAIAGRFYYNLLDTWRIDPIEFPATFSRRAALQIFEDLNRDEYFRRIYAEGRLHGERDNPVAGCLVLGHRRPNAGPAYFGAVYLDDDLNHCWLSYIVPNGPEGAGRIEVATLSGWEPVLPEQVNESPAVRVVLATLRNHIRKVDAFPVAVYEMDADAADEPPADAEYQRRVQAVAKGQMRATSGIVSLDLVKPHDADFCLAYRSDRLSRLDQRIWSGYRPAMVVYWGGTHFMMSDDYPDYLAYTRTGCDRASVVILGEFPAEVVEVKKQGGLELLPGGARGIAPIYPKPLSDSFKQWQIQQKHKSRSRDDLPTDLIATWMAFADLLADEDVTERDLHNFIFAHPAVLTAYGTDITSEVQLAKAYRIDVIVRAGGVRPEVTLVELEHHRHELFTAGGQPRAQITHAVQQVQDWFRWFRDNPTDPVAQSLRGLPPRGLVVAGRSRGFTDEQRDRLAHLNSGSPVTVITYDELLDRLADLILLRIES